MEMGVEVGVEVGMGTERMMNWTPFPAQPQHRDYRR